MTGTPWQRRPDHRGRTQLPDAVYFIPGVDDFGIYSNYAFVDSDIQE
jgi:hypothetical protein